MLPTKNKFSLSLLLEVFVKLLQLNHAATTTSYHCIKDKTTVHEQMPSHSTSCKGVTSSSQNVVGCAAKCDGPLVPIWSLNTVSATDGPCEWFAYDTDNSLCHICFPYSKTLPVILDFNTTMTMKMFSLVNMTCKKILFFY